jgi:hypothetical protein
MKRISLLVLGITAVSAVLAFAQAPALDNTTIVSALPANMRDGAGIVKWKPDFTYDTIKKSDNGLVCYDRSGFPLQAVFSVECTSMGNLPREAQNLKAEATGDKAKSEGMLNAEEKDGTRVKPEYGSVWYHLAGASKDQARPHMTIAMPGATAASTGLPDKRTNSGVWVMNAGTTTAHLMTPGE